MRWSWFWFAAALTTLAATCGLLTASPSWLERACNDGAGCGLVSPFLVGFVGVAVATALALVGVLLRS